MTSSFSLRSVYNTWLRVVHLRRVRERLCTLGEPDACLDDRQFPEAMKRLPYEPAAMKGTVFEGLYQRPLKHARLYRSPGIAAFLLFLEHKGWEGRLCSRPIP